MLKKYWKDFAIFWGIFVVFVGGVFLFFYLISEGKLGFMPTFEELENPTSNFAAEIYSADGEIIGKCDDSCIYCWSVGERCTQLCP